MLLKRNRTNILHIEGVLIGAGLNDLSEEQAKKLENHPVFISLLDNGVHQIVKKPTMFSKPGNVPEKTGDITEMKAGDAVAVIQGILSVQQLKDMRGRETNARNRKGVLSAIEDQITDIEKIPAADKESAGGD